MTTLTEMTANFPTATKELFEYSYKRFVTTGIENGLTADQANRMAFDILIKDDMFCKALSI